MRLHRRPFGGGDAVDHGVAQRAVRRDLVAAQNAVLLGAEALDGAATLVVEEVRAEFDRDAVQRLEGVPEQQQLALRVERPRCALLPYQVEPISTRRLVASIFM